MAEKKKKKHLHKVITTRARDGSFGHEHVYKENADDDHEGQPVFAGTSQSMDDLHAHMDDHLGPGADGAAEEAAEAGGGEPAGGQPAQDEPEQPA